MRKARLFLAFASVTFLLSQTACEDRTVAPKQTHWDAVKAIISEHPEMFRLGFCDTQQDTLFYREITENNPDIEEGVLVDEDTGQSGPDPFFPNITLTWGDSLKGTFHYRFEGQWHEKTFRSVALTDAYFEQWGESYDENLGWILRKVSGTLINSVGSTRRPSILHVVSSGVDEIITEPILTEPVKTSDLLSFGKGELVTFTLEPSSDTSDFFFLHVDEDQDVQKIPFVNNGDGTLSAAWTTNSDPARRYYGIVVDIVRRSSVTDTLAAYDSKAWGIVYRLE
jgi:hypothetical protein